MWTISPNNRPEVVISEISAQESDQALATLPVFDTIAAGQCLLPLAPEEYQETPSLLIQPWNTSAYTFNATDTFMDLKVYQHKRLVRAQAKTPDKVNGHVAFIGASATKSVEEKANKPTRIIYLSNDVTLSDVMLADGWTYTEYDLNPHPFSEFAVRLDSMIVENAGKDNYVLVVRHAGLDEIVPCSDEVLPAFEVLTHIGSGTAEIADIVFTKTCSKRYPVCRNLVAYNVHDMAV